MIKFLFKHPFFIGYMTISTFVGICFYKDPYAFLDAPLVVQIGEVITFVGGTSGMIILCIRDYKIESK